MSGSYYQDEESEMENAWAEALDDQEESKDSSYNQFDERE